jgi:aryl-alcohol dehydrogenase-like predicted oxidoreductase
MSYGQAATGLHQWTLDEDAAAPFFRQAVELGVTFWDTANVYQDGTSEEFVGRAVEKFSRREDIVLATKVSGKMHDGPGGSGLSRKAILEQLDASLRRLGTDYIDLYYYGEPAVMRSLAARVLCADLPTCGLMVGAAGGGCA